MSDFIETATQLHFLRPVWLLAVPCVVMIWWLVRRRGRAGQDWHSHIAPHLLTPLTINTTGNRSLQPVDLVTVVLLCLSIAAAGPAWRPAPDPFLSESAPLVIAVEVSESMLTSDLQPNRLERAKLKLLDLMASRSGARHALIAYAGTAHLVLPFTEDLEVLKPFLESLAPDIMPRPGQNASAALELASRLLASEETPGSLLLVTDGVDPQDVPAFAAYRAAKPQHRVLALRLGKDDPDGLSQLKRQGSVTVIDATLENSDIRSLERQALSNLRSARQDSEETRWDDQGWLLLWPAVVLALLWFRRGWTMPWIWLLVLAGGLSTPGNVRAEGFWDLWFTPDQQGHYAYEQKRYAEAAVLFQDPFWRATARYRAGRYAEAAELYGQIPYADSAFNQGNALVKAGRYNEAVTAFKAALERDPNHVEAKHNLAVTETIIAYLDRIRQQEDTGEQSELGADDFAFDNTNGEGKEIVITDATELKLESAEQWMRSVDSGPQDFLKTRFALEAAKAGRP